MLLDEIEWLISVYLFDDNLILSQLVLKFNPSPYLMKFSFFKVLYFAHQLAVV